MTIAPTYAAPMTMTAAPMYAAPATVFQGGSASIAAAPVATGFDMVDRNHDGVISRSEFAAAMGR
jgi:hypothetical protein